MSDRLVFSNANELISVPSAKVIFVEADGNYSSLFMADGDYFVLTIQLGQIERKMAEMDNVGENIFIRIGKSLIVNRDYITYINPARQKLVLSDCQKFRRELSASREALKTLKDFLEKDVK